MDKLNNILLWGATIINALLLLLVVARIPDVYATRSQVEGLNQTINELKEYQRCDNLRQFHR